ncbi:alpha/beta hydrolase [Microbacterium kyungheense]|uniref:Pimeloyl-ACP methyl ester carboxylesterase n=2 Tax=Microbacterium kyungheense TaxID=1263636 RepID=A0A543EU32_9MICO|nr:pimeloyl-ACP methyl ester carboxylesterase [Microbacterium kyungheense]
MTGTRSAVSLDGTSISYAHTGAGPGLVIVPGNNRVAHNYARLAGELADRFAVSVMERRGRGASGAQGRDYCLDREVEDVQAVQRAEQARLVLGHSYGGLIALQSARTDRSLDRVAVYEPAVSVNGSFDLSFLPDFERLLAAGRHARAMALFLQRTRLTPLPDATPRFVFQGLAALMVRGKSGTEMRDLMPTTPPELTEVLRYDSDGAGYAEVAAKTLLIGGTKTPAYLTDVLETLSHTIPHSHVEMLEGADHNAPDESAPQTVAKRLAAFLDG